MDQLLYSSSFRTISKILDLHETSPTIDKWLFNMIYSQPSSLLKMIKNYLVNYETDETKINSYLLPLCEFIKIYFNSMSESVKVPSVELLGICIDQMQACEIEKFRNLNKLAILINLIGSLLRVTCYSEVFNNRIFIQLIKSLVQVRPFFDVQESYQWVINYIYFKQDYKYIQYWSRWTLFVIYGKFYHKISACFFASVGQKFSLKLG